MRGSSGPVVADAGRAAVADGEEAELVQERLQAATVVVLGDDARAGCERGLDDRRHREAALHRLLGHQSGGEHDRRVAGVRARRDGGDQDVAVMQLGDRGREVIGQLGGVDAIGRRPVVHHLFFGDEAGVLLRDDGRRLIAAARHGAGLRDAELRPRLALDLSGRPAVAVGRLGLQLVDELRLQRMDLDPVLRPLRSGHAGLNLPEVELELLAVVELTLLRHAEEPLGLEVVAERVGLLAGAAGHGEVAERFVVDREEAHGRAVLRRHVGDRGPIGERERSRPFAEVLDELADDFRLAQHLGDGQHDVGGRDPFAHRAAEVDADDVGRQEVDRLTKHPGLGLDAADAPADDADAVDHRGVRVGADEGVGIPDPVLFQHAAREVLQVDLVHDADARRDDPESVEGLRSPLQELVALLVALELHVHVELQRVGTIRVVDLYGVIDDQIDRHERLDDLCVLAEAVGGGAHGGEVDEERHAGEVLQQDARDHERDLLGALGVRRPVRQRGHVLFVDLPTIDVAQDRFEDDADGNRELRDVFKARGGELRERVKLPRFSVAKVECVECIEGVVRHVWSISKGQIAGGR